MIINRRTLFLVSLIGMVSTAATGAGARAADAGASGAGESPQGASAARKKRVAVIDFDYATVYSSCAAIFGQNIDVGRGISDLLVTTLVKDGTYSVIERKALDKILAEQDFSNSERADANSAAKIGRLLGVDAIIVGSITQFGNDTKSTGLGGVGAGLGKVGLGGFNQSKTKAIVAIDARMVDVNTGEIFGVAEGRGESQRTSTSLLGGGGNWRGFGAGGVNFGSSDFQQTILGEAIKAAVDDMSTEVVANDEKFQVQKVVVNGLVAAVEEGQIILNVGGKAGVTLGDQLTVERVTKEIKDPATGRVIRRLATSVGVIRVVDVDAESSIAAVVSGTGFKIGDAVTSAR